MCKKLCLAKNEWNFVSWTMVCFVKNFFDIRQRFWNFVILALVVKNFFDNFGKISTNLKLFGKWKVEKWPSWRHLVKIWPFFIITSILRRKWLKWKNGQFLTKCHQEGHFSTFHLLKSFKFVEIFPKLSKKILTTSAKTKISKSLSDVKRIFKEAHHRSRNKISFIFC